MKIIAGLVLVVMAVSCAPTERAAVRQKFFTQNSQVNPAVKDAIENGRVLIGMNQDEVRASQGDPARINRTVTGYGVTEQWVYERDLAREGLGGLLMAAIATPRYGRADGRYVTRYYVYFRDGIVTGWQD